MQHLQHLMSTATKKPKMDPKDYSPAFGMPSASIPTPSPPSPDAPPRLQGVRQGLRFANPFDSTRASFIACAFGAAQVVSCPAGTSYDKVSSNCLPPADGTAPLGAASMASASVASVGGAAADASFDAACAGVPDGLYARRNSSGAHVVSAMRPCASHRGGASFVAWRLCYPSPGRIQGGACVRAWQPDSRVYCAPPGHIPLP